MADFFVANFTGSARLTAYTPDVGAAFSAPNTDLDFNSGAGPSGNSTWCNTASSQYPIASLFSFACAGGVVRPDPDMTGTEVGVIKPGTTPPSSDFAMETQFVIDPTTQATRLILAARVSPMTVSAWTDGYNHWGGGVFFYADGTGSVVTTFSSDGAADSGTEILALSGLPAGVQTYVLRLEVQGTARRIYWNGTLAYSDVVSDPNFAAGTETRIGLLSGDAAAPPATAGAIGLDYFNMSTLSAGVFWTKIVKAAETDL